MKQLIWINGIKLRNKLKECGYSIKAFSTALQISERTVYRWISKDFLYITSSDAKKISNILNCDLPEFATDDTSQISKDSKSENINKLLDSRIISFLTYKIGYNAFSTILQAILSNEYEEEVQVSILLNLANIEVTAVRLQEAEKLINAAAALEVKANNTLLAVKVELYKSLHTILTGSPNDGLKLLDCVLDKIPKADTSSLEINRLKVRALLIKLWAYSLIGNTSEAYEISQKNSLILEHDSNDIVSIYYNLQMYFILGNLHVSLKKHNEALELFSKGYCLSTSKSFVFARDIFQLHITDVLLLSDSVYNKISVTSINTIISSLENWHLSYPAAARILFCFGRIHEAIDLLNEGLEHLKDSPLLSISIHQELCRLYLLINKLSSSKFHESASNNLLEIYRKECDEI